MKQKKTDLMKMVQLQSLALGDQPIKLSDWLDKIRLTVTDFSELMGVSRSYIHMIMSGEKKPSQDLFDKMKNISMGKIQDREDLVG